VQIARPRRFGAKRISYFFEADPFQRVTYQLFSEGDPFQGVTYNLFLSILAFGLGGKY
jgi:hypothetical protein